MEATTIDQLFPDVLEEIFSHLSGSDLKNCALVCKDWDDVIGSYATTMKKLKIGFCLHPDHISIKRQYYGGIKIQSSDGSHRKHRNMEISIRDGSLTQLPSLDRFNISQVKTLLLRFMPNGSIELNKVVELLSRMPLLQMLTINFFGKSSLDTSIAPVAHFPKLKQLNVQSFSDQPISKIFEFIKADNLTEFSYLDYALHSEAEIDVLADFIWSKKSLANLEVSSNVFTQLLQRHDFSGMNLESLNVIAERCVVQSDIVIECFSKSLIFNAHSLTSLSIPPGLMSRNVLVTIFNRLTKLTTLEIIGYDGSWMDNLSPNDISHNLSLRTLNVERVGAIDGLKAILQRAPQLKKLSLGKINGAIMNEVATSAPRLFELRIDDLQENLTGDQRFNELKSLRIGRTYNVDSFASLLERCPKIEVFECQCYDIENPNGHIDILLQHKTLKHLICGSCCWPESNRIIFDKLKTNFGNLKSLGLRRSDGKFISFDFPENPAEWNVEEAEARFSRCDRSISM